jgi:hypothetical protein
MVTVLAAATGGPAGGGTFWAANGRDRARANTAVDFVILRLNIFGRGRRVVIKVENKRSTLSAPEYPFADDFRLA